MIVVTLGTSSYPFNRIVHWIALSLDNGTICEELFIQHGSTNIEALKKYPQVTGTPLLTGEKMDKKIDCARLIISHAGQGSTRSLAAKNKSFFIIPRSSKHAEHVDDHQIRFAEGVQQLGVTVCITFKDLESAILNPPTPLNKDLFSGPKLADFLARKHSSKGARQPQPVKFHHSPPNPISIRVQPPIQDRFNQGISIQDATAKSNGSEKWHPRQK